MSKFRKNPKRAQVHSTTIHHHFSSYFLDPNFQDLAIEGLGYHERGMKSNVDKYAYGDVEDYD